ncbi:MAG TPA: phosphotransferase family protein [Burkholderiaceae bacterium]|nr:phosphotransferase family protein [Burkholderiaceae bacterium]
MTESPESFRVDALADYLKACMQAEEVRVVAYSRLSGGAIQDNFGVSVECRGGEWEGLHKLVVRSDAPSKVAVSLSRAEEFKVLQVAYEAGVTVPRPLWCCEDTSVIGVPFWVMARVGGTASARELVREAGQNPARGQSLVRQLGRELARIHSISPSQAAGRLSFLRVPDEKPSFARVRQYRAALDAIPRPQPVLEWALNWLEAHAVDSGLRSLCHGDFRTGNYMVDDGQVSGVLDWEFASFGDPYEDLGWLCARSWRFGAPEREVGGIGHRDDLYTAWENETGHNVDDTQLRYWEVMGMVRWAIIALQQGERHLSGEQPSLELALTGRMLPEIELDILVTVMQIEGQPLGYNDLAPWQDGLGHPSAQESSLLAPHTANVLHIARQTLLNELLPQLPKASTYDALMVANAMAAAMRDLNDAGRSSAGVKRATCAFLETIPLAGNIALSSQGAPPAGGQGMAENGDPRETLALALRRQAVPVEHEMALRRLLVLDTCTRLALSNPKYLEAHRQSARATTTVESGD